MLDAVDDKTVPHSTSPYSMHHCSCVVWLHTNADMRVTLCCMWDFATHLQHQLHAIQLAKKNSGETLNIASCGRSVTGTSSCTKGYRGCLFALCIKPHDASNQSCCLLLFAYKGKLVEGKRRLHSKPPFCQCCLVHWASSVTERK